MKRLYYRIIIACYKINFYKFFNISLFNRSLNLIDIVLKPLHKIVTKNTCIQKHIINKSIIKIDFSDPLTY